MIVTLPQFKASMDIYKCNLQYFFHCNTTTKNSFEHYPEFFLGGGPDLGRSVTVTQCLATNLCTDKAEKSGTLLWLANQFHRTYSTECLCPTIDSQYHKCLRIKCPRPLISPREVVPLSGSAMAYVVSRWP